MTRRNTIIDCGDFKIRTLVKADADSLSANANDYEIWLNLRDRFPHPYTRKHALEWIDLVGTPGTRENPQVHFVIDVEGEAAGGIGLLMQTDVSRVGGELGYWLGKRFWGRGIMTRAIAGMTDWYFQNLPITRIYALVFDYNQPSARVLEKCGYTLEGRLKKAAIKEGKVVDELLYARVVPD